MLKAFWVWNPVCSGTYRRFDEPYMYDNNKWLFDKSVWQKMFRAMYNSGFDSFFLANTHPFPFMIRQKKFPEARILSDQDLFSYQQIYHWIFDTALQYDIKPYVLFFSIYYPDSFILKHSLKEQDIVEPSELSIDYTRSCVAELVETYPELAGIVGDSSENVREKRAEFMREAVIRPVEETRPDTDLIVRGWFGDPAEFRKEIAEKTRMDVRYSVKYTWEHLVNNAADPVFNKWVNELGGPNVLAEFWISNFEPWTSFSYTTATGIIENLARLNCYGFSMHPLSMYEWPYTSDTGFKFQWQRDLVWYNVWGGASVGELVEEQNPKWLARAKKLIPGFESASKILEVLALYFAGDRQNQWHPQFATIRDAKDRVRLLSVYDMVHLDEDAMFRGRGWWKEVTGQDVVSIAEAAKSEPDPHAFGPDELVETLRVLCDLADETVESAERRVRGGGEKELPFLAMDAKCMVLLGRFWMERVRAALALARDDQTTAVSRMQNALENFRELVKTDKQHRTEQFRVLVGRSTILANWDDILSALEREYKDAQAGEFKPGADYPAQRVITSDTSI